MSKPHLLQTGRLPPVVAEGLAPHFEVYKLWEAPDRAALIAEVGPRIEAVCTSGTHGVKADDAFMAQFPRLRMIGNFGVGYDSIDASAAAKRGLIVSNTPDVLTEEVADTTLGLLLMTVRELGRAELHLRAGRWASEGIYPLTSSLRDRSIGIAGLGRIGKAIARRCEAFGLPISYYGRNRQPDVAYAYHNTIVALAGAVDTLIIVTPGGPQTENLVNAEVLAALGPRGVVINMSRGNVIDDAALVKALKERTIHAAGLDVFRKEPHVDEAYLALDNAVLLPHVGSGTNFTRARMGQLVVDNLVAFAKRSTPPTPVSETPFSGW